jgi:2-amino-4-hydroxy-6-hydroxymethyldihydropteridine diphosphokinase
VWRWYAGVNDPQAIAFLAVGSNVQPALNVPAALELLAGNPEVTLTGISTFYRTPALPGPELSPGEEARPTLPSPELRPAETDGAGQRGDPDFLNGVLEIRTTLSPHKLNDVLQKVEEKLGRVRSADRYAPRTMDMDLLLYAPGSEVNGEHPWVPVRPGGACDHPDVRTRSFVALPLLELAPDLLLPPDGTSLRTVAEGFGGSCGIPEARFTEALRSRFLTF